MAPLAPLNLPMRLSQQRPASVVMNWMDLPDLIKDEDHRKLGGRH